MSLIDRTIAAAGWNYAGTAARIIGQLVAQVLLARLVGPQAFGAVGLSVLPIGLGCLIVEMGLGAALVQQAEVSPTAIHSVWARTTLAGVGMMVFFYFGADLLSSLLGSDVSSIIRWLSPLVLLHGLSVVPLAVLRRRLDMKSVQFSQLCGYLTGFMGVGVVAGWSGAGVWALVAAWLTSYLISFLLALKFSRLPLKVVSPFAAGDRQGVFARRVLGTNLFNWSVENLDNFTVGRVFGPQALGLYSVSYNLVRTPASHLVVSLQAALFPASARSQTNPDGLRKGYLAVVSAVAIVAFPVFLSMAAVSKTLVLAVYGAQWEHAAAVMAPLGIAMICHTIMAVSGPVLSGKGRPDIELRVQFWTGVLFLAVLLLAARGTVTVVAWGTLAVYVLRVVWLTAAALRELGISGARFLKAISGAGCLGMAVVAAIAANDSVVATIAAPLARLLSDIFVAGVAMLFFLWLGPSFFLAGELRAMLLHVTESRPAIKRFRIVRRFSQV